MSAAQFLSEGHSGTLACNSHMNPLGCGLRYSKKRRMERRSRRAAGASQAHRECHPVRRDVGSAPGWMVYAVTPQDRSSTSVYHTLCFQTSLPIALNWLILSEPRSFLAFKPGFSSASTTTARRAS